MFATITPAELNSRESSGQAIQLVDVRTPAEFQEAHVPFARNVPLDRLDAQSVSDESGGDSAAPLYVMCRSGARATKACEVLAAAQSRPVCHVDGGIVAWESAGLPLTRGKRAVSLERQVRIAAGSLVVLGVAAGWLVHPACSALAGLVGGGLVFAGVTDTCGMAMLLARMPWNQAQPSAEEPTACSI